MHNRTKGKPSPRLCLSKLEIIAELADTSSVVVGCPRYTLVTHRQKHRHNLSVFILSRHKDIANPGVGFIYNSHSI